MFKNIYFFTTNYFFMKKHFLLLLGVLFIAASCVDLTEINEKIANLENRLSAVEQTASTVSGISAAVQALQDKVYVETVTFTDEGCVIKFTDGRQATITNGKDGSTPTIGVKDVDGVLCWTVNNVVLKDETGAPVPATVKAPEFKFDNNKWWYRFGPTDSWKDCGEKTGPEPTVYETDEYVIISIGDEEVAIQKAALSPAIEKINVKLVPRKNLFSPVGQTSDLTEFFDVEPAEALKTMVDYTYTPGAFTIDKMGKVTVTGNTVAVNQDNYVAVKISAKKNPAVTATINIRACEAPNNSEIESTSGVPMAKRIYLYKTGLDDFNALASLGGAGAYNPVNRCLGGLMGAGGLLNMYFTVSPVGGISLANGHLHFSYYISSLEKLNPDSGQVELCSGGADSQERNWSTTFLKDAKVGWNEVDLALSEAGTTGGDLNPAAIKWFRMYVPTSAVHDEAVMVKDVYVYEVPDIESITAKLTPRKNLFIPVGETVDLKEFFDITPADALKTMVTYTYTPGALTVDANGKVTVTDNTVKVNPDNYIAVKIASKKNPEISATINIRACAAPNNVEITSTSTVPEASRKYLYKAGLTDFNALASLGGAGAFNPVNQCLGGLMGAGGNLNMYFTVAPFGGISIAKGHLHFEYYVSSLEKLNPDAGQVELCSGGADSQERNWSTSFLKNAKIGWNEIDLALSEAGTSGGDLNPDAIKWFRFFVPTSAQHDEAVMVKNVYVYEAQ